jgi:hypothetical protein
MMSNQPDRLERVHQKTRTLASLLVAAAVVLGCGETTKPLPPLTVTAVKPAEGPVTGGTAITITGTNFSGVTRVALGSGGLAARVTVGDTLITGTTPSTTSPGPVDVVVESA